MVINPAESSAPRSEIPASAVHLCLDMQNFIGPAGPAGLLALVLSRLVDPNVQAMPTAEIREAWTAAQRFL